jgi:8-oxo-dGTP diphosphatase
VKKVAVVCLIKKEDEFLIVNHYHRGWDLPGGYVKDTEDIISAVKREVKEETNFEISKMTLKAIFSNLQPELYKDEMITKTIFGFVCSYKTGIFNKNNEIEDYIFVKKENAHNYICDKLQLDRFNTLADNSEEILYIAYNKTPYYVILKEVIN